MSIVTAKRADMCYCPGCSHGGVLEALGRAIDRLNRPAHSICIVSDIGCIGTADRYFQCHTFHGLHGRSLCYAEGIKRASPETLVIVLIGDGGCGIGTAHLVHAARRNADIKVVVCNNFNFGMTGGQHSPTTPCESKTTTTPGGAADHPLDVCATVAANGAALAARHDAFDSGLVDHLEAFLTTSGFALMDVWELCTAYFVPANHLNRGSLAALSAQLHLPFGTIHKCPSRTPPSATSVSRKRTKSMPPLVAFPWTHRMEITVAGSAGQRIRSALGVIGELAVAGGLHVAQQDDFPITVRKGFSVSSLILSPQPILYFGLDHRDLVVILSEDGLQRLGNASAFATGALVVADHKLSIDMVHGRRVSINPSTWDKDLTKESLALAAVAFALVCGGWISGDALLAAAESGLAGSYRDENLRAIGVGIAKAQQETSLAVPVL